MKDHPLPAGQATDGFARATATFGPIFAEIAQGAPAREIGRHLPKEEIRTLARAGFGALRVPVERAGYGLSLPELFRLIADLAAADSNLTQALRAHFGLVEKLLFRAGDPQARLWLDRIGTGLIAGNAFTERSTAKAGQFATRARPNGDHWQIDGEKFYSTGSLFGDLVEVGATGPEDRLISVLVPATAEGLTLIDDWDGFGQRLTASGTTRLEGVRVPADHVLQVPGSVPYITAFYQLVHLATLAGISRAAARDVTDLLRQRRRTFSHGNTPLPAQDPQLLQVVGRISAQAEAASAIVERAAGAIQRASDAVGSDADTLAARAQEAEIATAKAQVVVIPLVLEATAAIFDALGASASVTGLALDRHWRNARVISSHNPRVYKERVIGDHAVNGTYADPFWIAGAV